MDFTEKKDIPVRYVDTQKYMEVLRSVMEEGKTVSLTITGSSMAPFLIHERDRVFMKKAPDNLKKGDVVFFQRENGQYVMHRIHHIRKYRDTEEKCYYMIGDNQTETEGPVYEKQVFGLITEIERKGKRITKGSFFWFFFSQIWIRMIPFRPFLSGLFALTAAGEK